MKHKKPKHKKPLAHFGGGRHIAGSIKPESKKLQAEGFLREETLRLETLRANDAEKTRDMLIEEYKTLAKEFAKYRAAHPAIKKKKR